MRVMVILVIVLVVIAVATYLLARRRTREAVEQRRRADQLEEQVNVWVEAERQGMTPSQRQLEQADRNDS
jgi:membrane protein implicated in regulation of membrane protease activity